MIVADITTSDSSVAINLFLQKGASYLFGSIS